MTDCQHFLQGVQTLNNRYRTHMSMVQESKSNWELITQIFTIYKEKVKPFHLKHLKDLSAERKTLLLEKCVKKEISLIELHKECQKAANSNR